MNRMLSVLAAVGIAALSLAAPAADAAIWISLQDDAGPVTVIGPNPGIGVSAGPIGDFESVIVVATGRPVTPLPTLLNTTLQVSNSAGGAAGQLTIIITSTNNTAPLNSVNFTSAFATTNLSIPWTETMQTFVDPNNGVFTTPVAIGSAFFNFVGSDVDNIGRNVGPDEYSVTTVIRVNAPNNGTTTAAVTVNGVSSPIFIPEPGSLALLGAALTGFGIVARRRRKVA